ncbi:hypothetical protein SAMN04487946_107113 [Halobellus clavatus]|jgi:hypothetical protein|uniref:Uncharacterized protein n=1 Tax=Halobellus clavatus TaxID=660517 RepID=A0A1H3HKY8_9EURY|nr:hypothetical protein SAMN04487946_107113 [Halobellus clavatus]
MWEKWFVNESVLNFTKDMFDAIAVSVVFVSEIGTVSVAGLFQRNRLSNEKHSVVDVVFPAVPEGIFLQKR